jgi:hypothetical protein
MNVVWTVRQLKGLPNPDHVVQGGCANRDHASISSFDLADNWLASAGMHRMLLAWLVLIRLQRSATMLAQHF